jgi:hypothetical protein
MRIYTSFRLNRFFRVGVPVNLGSPKTLTISPSTGVVKSIVGALKKLVAR